MNQWRARTPWNQTINAELFFNDGSLSGDQLLHWCFHEMNQLSNVNIITLLLVIDAGGVNSRLSSLLRRETSLPSDMAWLSTDKISFKNPACNSEIETTVAHCSTHNFKGARNSFLASSISSTTSRYFYVRIK